MPLTDTAIKALKPQAKPYKTADGGGMYLEITPNGSKYWRFRYRWLGKQKLLAFGVYPDVSLKDARDKRDLVRKQLAAGQDPAAVKKQDRENQLQEAENTFEKLAREWHQKNKAKWSEKHGEAILYRLEKDIFPEIGNLPIRSIAASTMLAAIRKMEARGAHELARRARGTCEQIFAYGIGTGRADKNVALNLRGTLEAFKRGHFAAIQGKDIPEFMQKLNQNAPRLYPQTIRATKILMQTFVRTSELIHATWDEFDLENGVWNIPAERMKMRKPHIVPLSRQTVALLREQQGETTMINTPWVFPNQVRPQKPMSEGTVLGAIKRLGYKGRMTGHGFRALAMSTIKEELGYRHEVVDRQLAHAPRNKIDAAYDRAEFLSDRKTMMQDWADYIDTVSAGGTVVHANFSKIRGVAG